MVPLAELFNSPFFFLQHASHRSAHTQASDRRVTISVAPCRNYIARSMLHHYYCSSYILHFFFFLSDNTEHPHLRFKPASFLTLPFRPGQPHVTAVTHSSAQRCPIQQCLEEKEEKNEKAQASQDEKTFAQKLDQLKKYKMF
jgi:hypothetical protein